MKTKYLLIIVMILILSSCQLIDNCTTVKFQAGKSNPVYTLKVPKGYKFTGYTVTIEKEYHYLYSDSSFIYLTNFLNTPNYENIKLLGDSITNFRFQNKTLVLEINRLLDIDQQEVLPDTFELNGLDKNHLFWCDIKIGEISIGYQNVRKENKEIFDKSLKSLIIRTK